MVTRRYYGIKWAQPHLFATLFGLDSRAPWKETLVLVLEHKAGQGRDEAQHLFNPTQTHTQRARRINCQMLQLLASSAVGSSMTDFIIPITSIPLLPLTEPARPAYSHEKRDSFDFGSLEPSRRLSL